MSYDLDKLISKIIRVSHKSKFIIDDLYNCDLKVIYRSLMFVKINKIDLNNIVILPNTDAEYLLLFNELYNEGYIPKKTHDCTNDEYIN